LHLTPREPRWKADVGALLVAGQPDPLKDEFGQPQFVCGRLRELTTGDTPVAVVINELLAAPGAGQKAFIELWNPNAVAVDISGWFWSDNKYRKAKFKIPLGTVMPPDSMRDGCFY
jgi:hypothetical protein